MAVLCSGGVEDGSEERGESLLGDILTGDALVTSSSSSSNAAGERSILELLGDSPATPPVSSSGSSLNELLGGGSEAAAFAPVVRSPRAPSPAYNANIRVRIFVRAHIRPLILVLIHVPFHPAPSTTLCQGAPARCTGLGLANQWSRDTR